MSNDVLLSIISMVSALGVAYIVNVASKKVQKTKSDKQPKDRMEQMFDGYERLIKQKDVEDERKVRLMTELEDELLTTREMVRKLEHSLSVTQRELELSRNENKELKDMLHDMRKEYELVKNGTIDSSK